MGGGNNYSSGLFQLLPGVYCDWKLSWLSRVPTHVWQVILVSDYGHSCSMLGILPFVNVLFFCNIGIAFSGRKDTSVVEL